MPYVHKYINKQEMSGIVKCTLKLTDSDSILPVQFIPVILSVAEFNEQKLTEIADDMINRCTIENHISTDSSSDISLEITDNSISTDSSSDISLEITDNSISTDSSSDISLEITDNSISTEVNTQEQA